jgi:hypothetical protein
VVGQDVGAEIKRNIPFWSLEFVKRDVLNVTETCEVRNFHCGEVEVSPEDGDCMFLRNVGIYVIYIRV